MISEVEHGTKSPSIAVLMALAEALGATVSELIEAGNPHRPSMLLLRHGDAPAVVDRNGVRREHLEPGVKGSRLEFVRYVLPPATEITIPAHAEGSIDHAQVIRGILTVWAGDESLEAEAGDTVVFSSDRPHGCRNAGSTEAALTLIIERTIFSPRATASRKHAPH